MAGTSILYSDTLKRQQWIRQGILKSQTKSMFDAYKGTSSEAMIYVKRNEVSTDKNGHKVNYDYDGYLVGGMITGDNTAFGNGETKLKFSDSIEVVKKRLVVDNGTEYDAVNIGSTNLSTMTDSRSKLSNLFTKHVDQAIIDAGQGVLNGDSPSHIIRPNAKASIAALASTDIMSYDFIMQVNTALLDGTDYTDGDDRPPLQPFMMEDGEEVFLWLLDPVQAQQLKQDDDFKANVSRADLRGTKNRFFKRALGKVGNFVFIEMKTFAGKNLGAGDGSVLGEQKVQIAGLRRFNEDGLMTGQSGFPGTTKIIAARSIIMGAGAIQMAWGKSPDYRLEEKDFGNMSQSALVSWFNVKKCILTAENGDYTDGDVRGYQDIDFGIVNVETYVKTTA